MRISVALCTYNGAQHLQEQLDSIAAQTQSPAEVVICDDGSYDATAEIVKNFGRKVPFDVRFHSNPERLGSSRNFEEALRLCQGDLIALCDQDDWWFPDKLNKQSEFLSENAEVDGVFSDGELMDGESKPLGTTIWQSIRFRRRDRNRVPGDDFANILLRQNVITGATLMLRSRALAYCLPFFPGWVHDGWIAWMLALHSTAGLIPSTLIRYRVHSSQQVGLPPTSVSGQISRARRTTSESYAEAANMFEELLRYLDQQSASAGVGVLRSMIADKIEFLRFREKLPTGRVERSIEILKRRGSYARFSQGWNSMMKDLLLRT